jgi:predicted DNA-binding protein YlxM (UPF0122 family)
MEAQTFIDELKRLSEHEDVLAVSREVNELKAKFEDFRIEEERKQQVAQIEAQERGEVFESDDTIRQFKDAFFEVFAAYREKRKAIVDERNRLESENLKKKRVLIAQLKELIQHEENIGTAFAAHKEINEAWKNVGDIPREKRQEVQQEYGRLLEEFFYNMSIYREIKDYDFKKNYDLKKDIIARIKELENSESIKEVEVTLKSLQNEWEDIGPTKQELWAEIKEEYWSGIKSVYDRIKTHYDNLREQMQENVEAKKELIAKTKDLLSQERVAVKAWNKHTDLLKEIQTEWKSIGFGPKKENEQLWKEFRGLCDQFFGLKSEFYTGLKDEFSDAAEYKEKLIQKVEEIKSSTDWKKTADRIVQLQRDWKKAGNAGPKNEQRLWKQFREACDFFFDARKAHFEALDAANEGNLKLKQELIEEIRNFQATDDIKAAIDALKNFSSRFNAIGPVPQKKKDEVYSSYKKALDEQYDHLNLKGQDKENILFEAHIATLSANANAPELFEREKQSIRNEINQVKQQIIQFENNLGFFANSKGADVLKAEVEKKIDAEKRKIEALKQKLKLIPNE